METGPPCYVPGGDSSQEEQGLFKANAVNEEEPERQEEEEDYSKLTQ